MYAPDASLVTVKSVPNKVVTIFCQITFIFTTLSPSEHDEVKYWLGVGKSDKRDVNVFEANYQKAALVTEK